MVQRNNDRPVPVIGDRPETEWQLAKQRASVRWLVAKAYNNQVPPNLRDPFYRDASDGVERLKPQIVHSLANAELYCSCLANVYADPNYHNLSHWGIIQALARKGVYVAEPSDVALTETVLIQTGPIKMSAHMAVMEAIQALYIREVITAERVVGVVRRFTQLQASTELPADQEEALLLWINKACARLRAQIAAECRAEGGAVPSFPLQQDISDLSDGTCLAGLVSLYCPDELSWPEIAFSDPPRIADSLYNLQLMEKFCREALPYNPHFLTLEDILYMHSSVKQNLLVLLADLFYLFEISPAKCVRQPVLSKDRMTESGGSQSSFGGVRRSQPELRSNYGGSQAGSVSATGRDSPSGNSAGSQRRPHSMYPADERPPAYRDDERSNSGESEFVVQRASGPLTLSRLVQQRRSQSPPGSVHSDEPPHAPPRRLKERLNRDTKWEERGEERRGAMSECGDIERYQQQQSERGAAGKPSPGAAGSRGSLSRRNSFSEESQLTVENFGGSQDNLQLLGRNPDKQPVVHRGRRESSAHRDLLKESAIDFGDRDPFQEAEQERALSRSQSRQSLLERSESRQELVRPPSRNLFESSSIKDHFKPVPARGCRDDVSEAGSAGGRAFRPIAAHDSGSDGVVDIDNRVLDALEREARGDSPSKTSAGGNNLVIMFDNNDEQKPTSFAELGKVHPRHQVAPGSGINIVYMQHEKEDRGKMTPSREIRAARSNGGTGHGNGQSAATTNWVQQQQSQRHGLAASEMPSEPDMMASELHSIKLRLEEKRRNIEKEKRKMEMAMNRQKQSVGKQAFLQAMGQDVSQSLSHMKEKWGRRADLSSTPDLENMDYDQYTTSLQSMNESLSELQDDIQRLSQQQHQMQHHQQQPQHQIQHHQQHQIQHHQQPQHQQIQQMHNIMQNGAQTQPAYQQGYQGGHQYGGPYPQQQQQQQFYLHDQTGQRRQWAAAAQPELSYGQHVSPSRARWGQPVRPMMGAGYPSAGVDPYQAYPVPHHTPPQPPPPGPFMLHQEQPGYGAQGIYPSPQHHRMDGGMMHPGGNYQPEYQPGYQQAQPSPGGFRLHGSPSADPPPLSEPRELRVGQSHRMYGDFQYDREERGSPRVPTVTRRGAGPARRRTPSPRAGVMHAPMPAPPIDDMAPQNVSFIGDAEDGESHELRADTAASPAAGSRTYRVPRHGGTPADASPTRATPPRLTPRVTPSSASKTFKVRGSQSPQSPSWAARRAGSQSPFGARPAEAASQQTPPPPEEEVSPEVLAAMKVDKIKADADPDMGFVISFDDDAAPRKPKPRLGSRRTPVKMPSSSGLLADRRPDIPPKPKPSSLSLAGGSRNSDDSAPGGAGGTTPSAFSTYTKWPRPARSDAISAAAAVLSSPTEERASPPPAGGGGLSLGGLSDPRKRTVRPSPPPAEQRDADRSASPPPGRPLLEKVEVDPNLPPEAMRPLQASRSPSAGVGLVIGDQLAQPKSEALDEMERKKERILMLSMKRKQMAESSRIKKEEEALRRKEEEERKEEEKARKKEEERIRKERIFEAYKLKKAMEEAEKNGTPMPQQATAPKPAVRPRPKSTPGKPRPKSMMAPERGSPATPSRGARGSSSNLQAMSDKQPPPEAGEPPQWGSNSSLTAAPRSRRGSNASLYAESRYGRPMAAHSGRKPSADSAGAPPGGMRKDGRHRTSTGSLSSAAPARPRSRMGPRSGSNSSLYEDDSTYRRQTLTHSGRRTSAAAAPGSRPTVTDASRTYSKGAAAAPGRHRSLSSLFGNGGVGAGGGTPRYSETDSGLGRDTPTRRGVSPGAYSRGGVTSPTGPGSLPPGLVSRRRNYGDDAASDTSSMASYDYNGPRLFKQPATKSNRSIMLNAVEYCVFPGAVNREAKQRVLEEIARVEARHFLILFRDARCQFRALYWYEPETEEVVKLYGTGPKMANDKMFDKFFKYNSGGKSFNQIHTKSLSVTIDAFTIHDALWQGKRPSLPSKKDMTLVT